MTIEAQIEKEEELIEELKYKQYQTPYIDEKKEYAAQIEESEQIISWLKELKILRAINKDDEFVDVIKKMQQDIKNLACDVENLKDDNQYMYDCLHPNPDDE